jgi:hypothetical protein
MRNATRATNLSSPEMRPVHGTVVHVEKTRLAQVGQQDGVQAGPGPVRRIKSEGSGGLS